MRTRLAEEKSTLNDNVDNLTGIDLELVSKLANAFTSHELRMAVRWGLEKEQPRPVLADMGYDKSSLIVATRLVSALKRHKKLDNHFFGHLSTDPIRFDEIKRLRSWWTKNNL